MSNFLFIPIPSQEIYFFANKLCSTRNDPYDPHYNHIKCLDLFYPRINMTVLSNPVPHLLTKILGDSWLIPSLQFIHLLLSGNHINLVYLEGPGLAESED